MKKYFRQKFVIVTNLCIGFWLLIVPLLLISTPAYAELVEQLKAFPATMRCEELEVSTLLRAMGRQAGINIFVADDIKGTISFEADNLTLFDVFQLIINSKGLYYSEANKVVSVKKTADPVEQARDIQTEKICADFGRADHYLEQLRHLKSETGSISVINQGNCLLVRDHQKNVILVKDMLKQLDAPLPQIHIEARIVAITDMGKKQLGVKWGYQNYKDDDALASKSKPINITSDLSVDSPSTSIAMGFIWNNMNLNVELQALAEDDQLEILSAPSVLVLDGNKAEIKQGQEVPYTSQSGDNLNTSFREANLSLQVTPKILENNLIMLDVKVTNDSVDETSNVGDEPLINRQELTTNLYLEDKVTVVIGGIKGNKHMERISGIPFLSDIPILGRLFKSTDKRTGKYELLIFITPTVVSMNAARKYGQQANQYISQKITQPIVEEFASSHPLIPGQPEKNTNKDRQ